MGRSDMWFIPVELISGFDTDIAEKCVQNFHWNFSFSSGVHYAKRPVPFRITSKILSFERSSLFYVQIMTKTRFIFKYILHVLYYSQHNSVNNRSTSRQHCHILQVCIISHLLRCRWEEPEIMLIDYFKFSVMLNPSTCILKFVYYVSVQVLPVLTNLCFHLRVHVCVQ